MNANTVIEFDIVPSKAEAPLSLTVTLDNVTIFSTAALTETQHVKFEVDDSVAGVHHLCWILDGKTLEHTKIDEQGKILSDSIVSLRNVHVDQIDISPNLFKLATYTHNCNGSSNTVTEPLYEDLGCNGVARLEFSTPIYLWLLEQM